MLEKTKLVIKIILIRLNKGGISFRSLAYSIIENCAPKKIPTRKSVGPSLKSYKAYKPIRAKRLNNTMGIKSRGFVSRVLIGIPCKLYFYTESFVKFS